MRINNRFCGLAYGRPMLEDTREYQSIKDLKKDYIQAIKDYHTHRIYTFPTVELDGEKWWAFMVYCDTEEEAISVMYKADAELMFRDGTDVYIMVNSDSEEDRISSRILED